MIELLILLLWLYLGELTIIKLKDRPHKLMQILISPFIHFYVLVFYGLFYYCRKEWDILTKTNSWFDRI